MNKNLKSWLSFILIGCVFPYLLISFVVFDINWIPTHLICRFVLIIWSFITLGKVLEFHDKNCQG